MFGGTVDDALVCLMRHKPVDLFCVVACFFQYFFRHFGEGFNGKFEYARPVHFHIRVAANLPASHLRRHFQQVQIAAVSLQFAVDDAFFVRRAQNDRTRTVSEQHAGCAVFPVQNMAECFRADNQHFLGHTAFDVGIGGYDGIHKSGANRLNVKCRATGNAEFVLHDGGRRRKLHIGGCRSQNNQVDFFRRHARIGQRTLCGNHGQIAGSFVFGGQVAEFDAGTADNPFVRCIDKFGKIIIADTLFRQIAAGTEDFCILHGASLSKLFVMAG